MQVDLIEKHADFLYDKEGVMIVTDIEKDNLGFEDDFDAYAKKVMSELKEKMTPEQFEKLANESAKIIKEFEN